MRTALAVPLLALLAVVPALTACEPDRSVATVLLAAEAGHWEDVDVPALRARVRSTCRGCEVEVVSADGDPAAQERQLDDALAAETDVVVLDPVDPAAAEDLVGRAGDVPVVAWGDVVPGADHFVGAEPGGAGRLLGDHVARLLPSGRGRGEQARLLVLGGPGTGPAAGALLETAVGRLRPGVVRVEEVSVADPTEATREVAARLGGSSYDVVLAGTDDLAAGAARALAGVRRPPALVGPEAGLEAARRIVTGDQAMSVYEPYGTVATQVADVVVALLTGDEPAGGEEVEGVESWTFEARPVTLASLTSTMVHDGAIGLDELCAGGLRARCTALGLL